MEIYMTCPVWFFSWYQITLHVSVPPGINDVISLSLTVFQKLQCIFSNQTQQLTPIREPHNRHTTTHNKHTYRHTCRHAETQAEREGEKERRESWAVMILRCQTSKRPERIFWCVYRYICTSTCTCVCFLCVYKCFFVFLVYVSVCVLSVLKLSSRFVSLRCQPTTTTQKSMQSMVSEIHTAWWRECWRIPQWHDFGLQPLHWSLTRVDEVALCFFAKAVKASWASLRTENNPERCVTDSGGDAKFIKKSTVKWHLGQHWRIKVSSCCEHQ